MTQDSPAANNSPGEASTGVGLPQLLNILFRGRVTILSVTLLGVLAGVGYGLFTEPLYRATAQVRPGIVAYSDQGGPVREWAIKDVVRWFRTGLFWDDLREEKPYDEFSGAPIVLADFISTGPQYQRGGDVITLTNLSTDPLVAVDILRRSIVSFNTQARGDSTSNTFQLTLGGAQVRMDKIRSEMEKVDGEMARANLLIREKKSELATLDSRQVEIEAELTQLQFSRSWRLEAVDKSLAEAEAASGRLVEAEKMLAKLEVGEGTGELVATVNELGAYVYHSSVRADSLRDAVHVLGAKITALEQERDVELAEKRKIVQLKVSELEIQRDVDWPSEKALLAGDLQAEQVQVDMLIPLEQVGRVTVSQKPVRPRKLRALAILTILAFLAAIFLVFVREYFRLNRAAILAARPD